MNLRKGQLDRVRLFAGVYAFSSLEKSVELDYHWVEFNDVRYHVQVSMKNPHIILLSVSLPTPPLETVFVAGLPFGAIEAIKAAYGVIVQILDPPRDGFNLTLKLNLSKLPPDEEYRQALLVKVASVREVVLGAPLRVILKHLASRTVAPGIDRLVALVHRPNESFFLVPQAEKVTVVFPMRFKDSVDTVLATSFLQEFMESRRAPGLSNAPLCTWSHSPPLELNGATDDALSANAGFVTFGLEELKGDVPLYKNLGGENRSTVEDSQSQLISAYSKTQVDSMGTKGKCSEGFMHTRMRRRVESLIQALDRAKPDQEKAKKTSNTRSFKRLSLKDSRTNSN
ncbi:ARP2/3 complex, 34kDa subunit (p34-Arc) [Corchorus olitorius]|uniref:Arp2/3 complex 34 kDa subunit n=1 Tax=Corchorus olitorius TaxID=93759 RepID=A0A1R3I576_9ROSI|nr:ARP2/3 complex, 34kDa subunit (p34-Arc) [Corchorus olitorius]